MFRNDSIFWSAAVLSLLAIVMMALTDNQLWLALMILAYLLRPTLASLGVAKRHWDERQMSIHYRSANIAFAVMIGACVVLAGLENAKGNPNWDLFNIVIIAGLAAKALFNVLLVKNYREAATRILMTVGLLIALFGFLSHGFSLISLLEATPGLLIFGIGWLSRVFPRVIGTLIFVLTAALLVFILGKGFTIGQLTTAVVIGVPLILAGVCLFAKDEEHGGSQKGILNHVLTIE